MAKILDYGEFRRCHWLLYSNCFDKSI